MKGYVVQREMFMCEWIPGGDGVAVVVQLLLSPGRVIAASREPCNHVAADVKSDDDGCQHAAVVVSCALLISGLNKFKFFLY